METSPWLRPVGPSMVLGAGGIYALRCAAFTLSLTTFALALDGSRFPAVVVFPAIIALGVGFGLFAFLADYRARRGRRTTLGPLPLVFLLGLAFAIVFPLLYHAVRAAFVGSFDLERATTWPCSLLFVASFLGRLAPWPWSPSPPEAV